MLLPKWLIVVQFCLLRHCKITIIFHNVMHMGESSLVSAQIMLGL